MSVAVLDRSVVIQICRQQVRQRGRLKVLFDTDKEDRAMTLTTVPTANEAAVCHDCRIVCEHQGQTRLIRVIGRMDRVTAGQFRDLMRDECMEPALVVDLGATEGMDAAGVGVLLAATAQVTGRGQRMVVVVSDPFLLAVLLSTGLATVVHVVATEAEALARLAK
jgi:anti-anti-sigma factor